MSRASATPPQEEAPPPEDEGLVSDSDAACRECVGAHLQCVDALAQEGALAWEAQEECLPTFDSCRAGLTSCEIPCNTGSYLGHCVEVELEDVEDIYSNVCPGGYASSPTAGYCPGADNIQCCRPI